MAIQGKTILITGSSSGIGAQAALQLGDCGIAVTTVYFPMVRTEMSGKTAIYKNMRMMNAEKAAGWIVEAVDKRPARVSSPVGALGSVLLTALPGPVIEFTRPFFRRMDQQLAKKLKKG